MNNTIWITGSKGQLGTELQLQQEKLTNTRFLFTDIEELDLTNRQAVIEFALNEKPAIIINCAAYTAVDKAEEEQEKAFLLNRDVPAFLTEAAEKVKAILIHISTDYVLDGTANTPYKETDDTNPQSLYGKSKLAGEEAVLKNPENLVLRTSWLYSAHGHNFLKTMLRLGKEREEIGVVSDQLGSPTSATDMADALLEISKQIMDGKKDAGGVYHYSNEGKCSWYDFAKAIMKTAKLDCRVNPITTEQYPTPAKRPQYSVLDKGKLKDTFGINIPDWQESAEKVIGQLITSG
jgi:dTDP-4-dehydrorhamnose reductase